MLMAEVLTKILLGRYLCWQLSVPFVTIWVISELFFICHILLLLFFISNYYWTWFLCKIQQQLAPKGYTCFLRSYLRVLHVPDPGPYNKRFSYGLKVCLSMNLTSVRFINIFWEFLLLTKFAEFSLKPPIYLWDIFLIKET